MKCCISWQDPKIKVSGRTQIPTPSNYDIIVPSTHYDIISTSSIEENRNDREKKAL
jgi:hypothetical protein